MTVKAMSYEACIAALNLEMTDRVPRTEYSADTQWELVAVVTGIDTSVEANRGRASHAFMEAWEYCLEWSTPGGHEITVRTDMGHGHYVADGSDLRPASPCPFSSVEQALSFDPAAVFPSELIDEIVEKCNRRWRPAQGDDPWVVTGGVYETLFSGLICIFGWDMLLTAAGTDERRFARVIDSYVEWIAPYFEGWARSEAPVIMSHDDICWTSGPVFAPDWYRKYIFPKYKRLWRPVLEAGKKLMFTADGAYHVFFDDIVAAGAHALVMEPMSDMALFARRYGRSHAFVGNADTRVLLLGTKRDIYNEVKRCMDIGRQYPGFIMAVGNHIPANTPVDNALYYNEAYLELCKR
ncbi:MAG TPA: uroporphyrinogen decarboxylase family protein [Phycisphaerae bacterium]|nr:uroporphyrinogen decarboxylase family protein [Phycisphaerae bacterium]